MSSLSYSSALCFSNFGLFVLSKGYGKGILGSSNTSLETSWRPPWQHLVTRVYIPQPVGEWLLEVVCCRWMKSESLYTCVTLALGNQKIFILISYLSRLILSIRDALL